RSKSLPIGQIRLYDTLGRMMIDGGGYKSDDTYISLDVEELTPGVYYVYIQNDVFRGSVKVVKK
ncbi:MAG TPA: T9SS type A sorting domain-containing protein, partial [Saprospiraceae bacterium]|nr:T9SS type A sorting domain-containing protein [Saprospiraceae bacterium]